MQINGRNSSFQSVILELIREELNMMLCETFQLKKKINFTDNAKLTKMILKQISTSQINSPHLTPEKARRYIKLLDNLDCHKEIGGGLKKKPTSNDDDWQNPYSDSPFF